MPELYIEKTTKIRSGCTPWFYTAIKSSGLDRYPSTNTYVKIIRLRQFWAKVVYRSNELNLASCPIRWLILADCGFSVWAHCSWPAWFLACWYDAEGSSFRRMPLSWLSQLAHQPPRRTPGRQDLLSSIHLRISWPFHLPSHHAAFEEKVCWSRCCIWTNKCLQMWRGGRGIGKYCHKIRLISYRSTGFSEY